MKKTLSILLAAALICIPLLLASTSARADDKSHDEDRLENSGQVLKEIMNIPDDIPQSLLDKADCVIVIPSVLKAAFIVGGSYGRGAMTCRSGETFQGPWGAPTMMALEGGSFGFQLGGQATDFVLLVMNQGGARSILSSKVKLGGDASAAAGPVGRDAEADTDVTMRAEVPHLFPRARPVRRHFARGFDAASRQRRERAHLRPQARCEGRRAPRRRADSAVRENDDRGSESAQPQEPFQVTRLRSLSRRASLRGRESRDLIADFPC